MTSKWNEGHGSSHKLKQDNIIKNFDIDTYQIGTKYANDNIVIIIEK